MCFVYQINDNPRHLCDGRHLEEYGRWTEHAKLLHLTFKQDLQVLDIKWDETDNCHGQKDTLEKNMLRKVSICTGGSNYAQYCDSKTPNACCWFMVHRTVICV